VFFGINNERGLAGLLSRFILDSLRAIGPKEII
jgi:hypothetical protein